MSELTFHSMDFSPDRHDNSRLGPNLPLTVENELLVEHTNLVALLTSACQAFVALWKVRYNMLRSEKCTLVKIEQIDRRCLADIRKLDRQIARFHALTYRLPSDLHRDLTWLFLNLGLGDAGVTLRDLDTRSLCAQRLSSTLLDRERYEGQVARLAREAAQTKPTMADPVSQRDWSTLLRPLAAYEEIFEPMDRLLRAYHLDGLADSAGVDLVPICSEDLDAELISLHGVVHGSHSRSVHARAFMALAEAIRPLYAGSANRIWWDHYRPRFLAAAETQTPTAMRQLYVETVLCTMLVPTESGCGSELATTWINDAFSVGYEATPFAGAEWNAATDIDWDTLWLALWLRVARDQLPLAERMHTPGEGQTGRSATPSTAIARETLFETTNIRLPVIEALAQKILESLDLPIADFSYVRAERHGAPDGLRFAVGANCAERRLRACTELLVWQFGTGTDPETTNRRILTALERVLAYADITIHPSRDGVWAPRFGILLETIAQSVSERLIAQRRYAESGLYDRLSAHPPEAKRELSMVCVSQIISLMTSVFERALLSANRALAKRARQSLRLLLRILPSTEESRASPMNGSESLNQTNWARELFQRVVMDTFQQESKSSRRAVATQLAGILLPYFLPPMPEPITGEQNRAQDLAKHQEAESSLLMLLDFVLEGTSASDAAFAEAAYRLCIKLVSHFREQQCLSTHSLSHGGVFLSPEAYRFCLEEWIPRFAERVLEVLESLEKADATLEGARLQRFEWMILAISELLQRQSHQGDRAVSAWYRVFVEQVIDNRLAGERALENASKEWAAIVRALCASASDSERRRMLMDRLVRLASLEHVSASLRAWRLRLLGQACRRYPDATELADRYGNTIKDLAMDACAAYGERELYKAGGKLLRGLLQGLSDTWPQSIKFLPLSEAERWQRVRVLWDRGEALRQCCLQVCWEQIHIGWRQPTLDTLWFAWSLIEENLGAVEDFLGEQSTKIEPDRAKAAARWLFSLRRGARWLLSGKKRPQTPGLLASDSASVSSDADDCFDGADDIDAAVESGTEGNEDAALDAIPKLANWAPLDGEASGFIDWLPSNAAHQVEHWQALVTRVVLASDPDTLQREALRPLEIAHQGFEYDGLRAQHSGRGRARHHFALQVLEEFVVDTSPWALLHAPDEIIRWLALAALERRRSFAARAGAFGIWVRNSDSSGSAFPNPLLSLLRSERGILSDYAGVAQRARSLLLPACRYLSSRSIMSRLLEPIEHELDQATKTDDESVLLQHRVRLESILFVLDALLPRLSSEATMFRKTIAMVFRSGCRGSWMTLLPSVHGLAMMFLMKACLRVRRLSILTTSQGANEAARQTSLESERRFLDADWGAILERAAISGVYMESNHGSTSEAQNTHLVWHARAIATLLLVYYDLVAESHWRHLGIRDQQSAVAQSWQRAVNAAIALANDAHRAVLRQIGALLLSRLCACGVARIDPSNSFRLSAVDVQQVIRSMYRDARGPLPLFLTTASSPVDAAVAASNDADIWSSMVTSIAQQVSGTGVAAHLASTASSPATLDAVSFWELFAGGPEWPSIRDGRLGSSAIISRRPGEHWSYPMLVRVRCLEHLYGCMDEQERQKVIWYLGKESDRRSVSTLSPNDDDDGDDDIERLRRLEHEILVATALRDYNQLGRIIKRCTVPLVWRSLAAPALRYLVDHLKRSESLIISNDTLYQTLVLQPLNGENISLPDSWGMLFDETTRIDSNALLRALHSLEALGPLAPPASLHCELLMSRTSGAEREAAASLLAVWAANHESFRVSILRRWRSFIDGLEEAVALGEPNTESALADRLFAARDTLISFLQRICYWRQRDVADWILRLDPAPLDWCLQQLCVVIVLEPGNNIGGLSGTGSRYHSGATLGQREALAQRARSVWYQLALTRFPRLLHRSLKRATELASNSRTWTARETAINAIHLKFGDHPFLLGFELAPARHGCSAESALRWMDELMPFLNDPEIPVRKAAAQALASWCRWFVPNATDGDSEEQLHRHVIKTRWCDPNSQLDDHARALALSALIQSHPYDVHPCWMSEALRAMAILAEPAVKPRKEQKDTTCRRQQAAQVARRCLRSFSHLHRAQWTREQEQLEPSVRELLSELWLGSVYVI
jgi:hypothetical protein